MKGNRSPRTPKQLQALARTNLKPKTEAQIQAVKNNRRRAKKIKPEFKVKSRTVCISSANEAKLTAHFAVANLTQVLKKLVLEIGQEHDIEIIPLDQADLDLMDTPIFARRS